MLIEILILLFLMILSIITKGLLKKKRIKSPNHPRIQLLQLLSQQLM